MRTKNREINNFKTVKPEKVVRGLKLHLWSNKELENNAYGNSKLQKKFQDKSAERRKKRYSDFDFKRKVKTATIDFLNNLVDCNIKPTRHFVDYFINFKYYKTVKPNEDYRYSKETDYEKDTGLGYRDLLEVKKERRNLFLKLLFEPVSVAIKAVVTKKKICLYKNFGDIFNDDK